MKTASERRAAGEDEVCSCVDCVAYATRDLRWLATRTVMLFPECKDAIAMLLRAIVIVALLEKLCDPSTWAPKGWHP